MGPLDLLSTMVTVEMYTKREVIFRQGEASDRVYIIYDGLVRISTSDDDGETLIGMLKEDEVFGEIGAEQVSLLAAS